MYGIRKLTGTNTKVNTLVEDIYDVADPVSGTLDTDRRDIAAQALRNKNPTLPADDTSFNNTLLAFIWLPRLREYLHLSHIDHPYRA